MEMEKSQRSGPAPTRHGASPVAGRRGSLVLPLALAVLVFCLVAPVSDALAAGTAGISGVVTSAESKEPIAGIEACARETAPTSLPQCTTTDKEGKYEIAGLGEGQYDVSFSVPGESPLNYLPQFYKGAATKAEAEPVTLVEGVVSTGIDAALLPGGAIAGTVSSAATKATVSQVRVCARDAVAEVEHCAMNAADGSYTVSSLPTGSYLVHFEPSEPESKYAPQFYKDAVTEAAAEAVPVTAGAGTTGIDAALQGVPVAVLKPAIVGRAVEGQTLSFLAGTWTNAPTSLIDEWGRCEGAVIGTCSTIATTPTYTLTSADVGHTIRIREQAANAYGVGVPQYLFSPASAIVVAPAPALAGAAPATAPPVTTGLGVLSNTASAATTAQLKALLASLLAPHGKRAKISALLKHHGYAISFVSLIAGRLSIAWYLVPKGARVAAAKPVLVAVGKIGTPASGAAKLNVKLTARGRRLLAPGKPLKLTAKGVLAVSGRPSLVAKRSFTLKR
jgi:carboxypeptidase family protein